MSVSSLSSPSSNIIMSSLKPKMLFRGPVAMVDEGIVSRLEFSDDEDVSPINSEDGHLPLNFSASPIRHSSPPNSDDGSYDHLDSSTDSAVGGECHHHNNNNQRRGGGTHNQSNLCHHKSIEEEDEDCEYPKRVSTGSTPPYKGVRALRLFGSPQSPKSLLHQSRLTTAEAQRRNRSRLFAPKSDFCDDHDNSFIKTRRVRPQSAQKVEANINPFTKTGLWLSSKAKRRRENGLTGCNESIGKGSLDDLVDDTEQDIEEEFHPLKRIRDTNISRYATEFLEVCQIGSGEFGSVYRCIHRLDGCEYALKKSRKPLKGTADERRALNEVYAHALLGWHTHVVRYYSAWAEDDHMLIQNEYCNGGSLADVIEQNKASGVSFSEQELKQILLNVAEGLKYIHSKKLAHMDIKPGNIFIARNSKSDCIRPVDLSDDGFEEEEIAEEEVTYKIGDLGHVTSLVNPEVEEGDCRYLPAEILNDDYSHLPKADIFALGLSIYETGGGGSLPKNGTEWHDIRKGNITYLSNYSEDLNNLIKLMIDPDPEKRPSSLALLQHRTLVPYVCKTKAQLNKELNVEKLKNQFLSRKLQEASKYLRNLPLKESTSETRLNRVVGGKFNRSNSVTNF